MARELRVRDRDCAAPGPLATASGSVSLIAVVGSASGGCKLPVALGGRRLKKGMVGKLNNIVEDVQVQDDLEEHAKKLVEFLESLGYFFPYYLLLSDCNGF